MAQFIVKQKVFKEFLSAVMCTGTIDASTDESGTKVKTKKGSICSVFVLSVEEDGLHISCKDSIAKKVVIIHHLKVKSPDNLDGVELVEGGKIPISDADDVVKALDRFKMDDKVSIVYPDENAGISYVKNDDKGNFVAGFRHGIEEESKVMETEITAPINFDPDLGYPAAKRDGKVVVPYDNWLTLPAENLTEVEGDIDKFIKKSMVTFKITPETFMVFEGSERSGRGGKRVIHALRKNSKEEDTFKVDIETKFTYGINAVLKNLSGIVNLYFGKMKPGWYIWIRADNIVRSLNYLVPCVPSS